MVKRAFLTYINAGLSDNKYDDIYRRTLVVNLFSFIGLSLTLILGLTALVNQSYVLASILLVASCTYYIGYQVQKRTQNVALSSNIILYSLGFLLFYLTFTGGVNNTGPLWIFIISPVALFVHGLKKGLVELTFFLIIITFILFLPFDSSSAANYPHEFKLRLLLSFLTVTFLSAFYEYSREMSHKHMVELSNEFEQLAKIDPLTKLSNRRDGINWLNYEMKRLKRSKEASTLLLADIDYFKQINDNYGHRAGDDVLKALAKFFKSETRAQDIVVRWGGEEFLFILPQTDIEQAEYFAKQLLKRMRKLTIDCDDKQLNCSMSIGVSTLSPLSIEKSLQQADNALYQAKDNGRDQVVVAAQE